MASAATKRLRNKRTAYLKKREEQGWSKMSYYDKVHVGDIVEQTRWGKSVGKFGLVVATADTVDYDVEWGDTLVLWRGSTEPIWDLCGALEVISEVG